MKYLTGAGVGASRLGVLDRTCNQPATTMRNTTSFTSFGTQHLPPERRLPALYVESPEPPRRIPLPAEQVKPLSWLNGRSPAEVIRASRFGLMLDRGSPS